MSGASRSSKVIFPLCSALMKLHLECCFSSGLPSSRRTVTEPTDTSWNLENPILNIKGMGIWVGLGFCLFICFGFGFLPREWSNMEIICPEILFNLHFESVRLIWIHPRTTWSKQTFAKGWIRWPLEVSFRTNYDSIILTGHKNLLINNSYQIQCL